VINRKFIVEGVPSKEDIEELISRARPAKVGIILTKAPYGDEDAENALQIGLESLALGDEVGLFLLSDGIWVAKEGLGGLVGQRLTEFKGAGGKAYVSGEHLIAGGLDPTGLSVEAEIVEDPFDRLVDLVMDEWEKVIVF
jgi:sulfur relay (sulfurtransferase) DsrF/TusC family protein